GRSQQLLLPELPALVLRTAIGPAKLAGQLAVRSIRQFGGGRSYAVAKSFRQDVLVCSLDRLVLRGAAHAQGREVHKRRPPLGDQLSHTCPNRWRDLKARTTKASRHVESVEVRSPIQNGPWVGAHIVDSGMPTGIYGLAIR